MASWCLRLFRSEITGAPEHVGHSVAGVLFVGPGLSALAHLRAGPDGWPWTVLVLLATWLNDTAAYAGGRLLGRHRLAPAVSPGKTWEGFAFGALGSLAGIFVSRVLLLPRLTLIDCLALGTATAIAGPVGDLCKSVLKRASGVKDSGRLIPGHGGILDRIDAVLFNAPIVLAISAWLSGS